MKLFASIVVLGAICIASPASLAAEGSTVAGPIGGTDIRSAQLPPPGVYGGTVLFYAEAHQFFDAHNKVIPALTGLRFVSR